MRHYRRFNAVELVPVDLDLNIAELKPKFDELFDRIEEASPKYCQLQQADRQQTEMGGFAYLNSPAGALLQSEMQREMRAVVEAAGDPALEELHALWTRTNDLRELAMLSGVEAYARQALFKKGVLTVGSGHRGSLYEKSRLPRGDGPSPVTWEFEWELEGEVNGGDRGQGGGPTDRHAPD